MKPTEPISPDRLFEASMAVLQAIEADGSSRQFTHPLRGTPGLQPFTAAEVDEAVAFLVRLGMLEPTKPKVA
jgi:hypothetical protein